MAYFCIVQIWLAVLTLVGGVEFVVRPTSETVAPNSYARFKCVVNGDDGTHVQWVLDGPFGHTELTEHTDSSTHADMDVTWHTRFNTSLAISTLHGNVNGTAVQCRAALMSTHSSKTAILKVAAPPLRPDGLIVKYNSTETTVELQWRTPFTHLPQFPILSYMANVVLLKADGTASSGETININGTGNKYVLALNKSEICTYKRLCITLTARNSIGYSPEASESCTDIVRDHQPFPVNTTLSIQSDGRTLITVVFQKPPCFPQGMLHNVVVEEASPLDSDFTTPSLSAWEDELMERYVLATMKQDVMYSVTVYLSSESENTSSVPAYVILPAQATGPENGGGSGGQDKTVVIIAAIVGTLLLAVLIIVGLATSISVIICVRRKERVYTTADLPGPNSTCNQMQPNPLYENTLYDTIQDFGLPRPPSYESHIYQDMPELVRTHANEALLMERLPPGPTCATSVCAVEGLVEVGKNESTAPEGGGVAERESDYIVMQSQSVTESSSPLQTDL